MCCRPIRVAILIFWKNRRGRKPRAQPILRSTKEEEEEESRCPRSVMAKPLSDGATNLLKRVSTATLTTQLFRRGFRNVFMQGVAPLGKVGSDNLVGPAFTLRNIPAREDIDVLDIFLDPENAQRQGVETG